MCCKVAPCVGGRNSRAYSIPATRISAAYRAAPEALTLPQLRGEVSRLYEISLDALADAQRGVVVGVDSEGQPVRRVSEMDVARLLPEARQTLALVARFNGDSGEPPRDARARRTVGAPSAAFRR